MSYIYLNTTINFRFMDQEKQKQLQRTFGANVKKARLDKNLTQMQLAVKAETDIRQIQRIEAGEIATSIAQAMLISEALQTSLDSLFD